MNKRIQEVVNWYEKRSPNEHLWILLLGVVIIAMLWYYFIFHPLEKKKALYVAQARDLNNQISVYQAKTKLIEIEGPKKLDMHKQQIAQLSSQQQKLSALKFHPGSVDQHNLLIRTIFTTNPSIKYTSLRSSAGTAITTETQAEAAQNLQISFEGAYFDTIAYLETLEKLPWCLSWDTLEYKVLTYPNAEVKLELHIVNT